MVGQVEDDNLPQDQIFPYNDCNAMVKAHDTPYIAILEKIKAKQ
jgi:hypothetical protein